jgi:hypothetical protein
VTTEQEIKITWEWEPAESVRTPEHRATWARIEIKVGSDLVTLVEDRGSGSSRRSIYCPLYPLAEWVAYNWWFLLADTRPSTFLAQDGVLAAPVWRSLPAALREHHTYLESPPEAASQEELEQIAQRYGVSSMVIEHQLRNHLIAPAA